MSVNNADFVLVNYTLTVKESGEVIETTLESVAKEKGIHRTSEEGEPRYEPRFLVTGEGWMPKGLEDALIGMEVGKQATVEVPPEKGYGTRDASKVKLVPIRRFRAENITPVPGMHVHVDGKGALVRSVGAGRVQLDYNHPLAGRTLVYNVTIEKILETREDKILNLIHRRLADVEVSKFGLRIQDNEVSITVPEEAFLLEGLPVAKRAIASDVQKFMPDVEKVLFVEVFPKKIEEETKPAETKAEGQRATEVAQKTD